MSYQTRAFRKVGASPDRLREITSELKTILLKMYDEYRGPHVTAAQPFVESLETLDAVDFSRVDLDESQADIFTDLMQERINEQNEMISNDVDKYLADRFVNPLVPRFDIAQWWKINSSTYPTLS